MPKMKTHKGIAKRIKKTGTGKLMYKKGFMNHKQVKKNSARKRRLNKEKELEKAHAKDYRKMIPYQ
ncbi:50S ribosomal protein L35 [Halarsenatibacter silvermanii]|uniref:Large ribosomal subunit protein bL35 n=1 Tax=Halarsenatibacter silvermanii TaxID=321763 RepID=A0A1G9K2W2_9FIRM|nr:50S ribosomal protein L35 [Halarsenatibacter silvermanii]SDL44121.1 LSU ribosomal protein L35P [Halarsenatibacter silvermanii]